MTKIGVVIPYYKDKEKLEKCIKHLEKQTIPYDLEIIDNNAVNLGFTIACNHGIENLIPKGVEIFLLLNQDCYLRENALEEIVKFYDNHPKCGILGAKQISYHDKTQIIHAGCKAPWPNGIHIAGVIDSIELNKEKKHSWVNGACYAIHKKVIMKIGLLDENFVLIASDSDYCFTARAAGFEVWYAPKVECLHEVGVSSRASDVKLMRQMRQDSRYFEDKWIVGGLYKELISEIFS